MYTGRTLFTQLMDFLPWKTFHLLVSRYNGDHRFRMLPCTERFRVLAFAQLIYRESLRDIEACLATIYVMDLTYTDFEQLFGLHEAGAFFMTRAKSNTDLRQVYSVPSDREQGIICDQTVALYGFYSHKHYPHYLRRVYFEDPATKKTFIFLTNLSGPPPMSIRELYTSRRQIQLFFKWIKQHLHIKMFYDTS